MNFTNRFPYTTLNNINLDWIIKRVKELGTTVRSYAQDIASAAALAETAQEAAESALNNAQTAQTAAADALDTAESASATAEGVAATANAAQAAAQAAQTTAQAAQTTAQAAQTAVAGKQDAPATPGTAGQVLGLDGNLSPVWVDQSGGGGGTSDYNALANKPSINNVTLSGNKTGADLGLASSSDLSAVSTAAQTAQTTAQAAQTAAQAAQTTADDAADDAADAMTAAQAAQTTANNKENAIASSVTGVLYRTASGVIRAAALGTEYGARTFTLTLTAAGWSNGSQTISNADIFSSASYGDEVSPAPASLPAYASAGVYASGYATGGGLVFQYTGAAAPASDLTVYVRRFITA